MLPVLAVRTQPEPAESRPPSDDPASATITHRVDGPVDGPALEAEEHPARPAAAPRARAGRRRSSRRCCRRCPARRVVKLVAIANTDTSGADSTHTHHQTTMGRRSRAQASSAPGQLDDEHRRPEQVDQRHQAARPQLPTAVDGSSAPRRARTPPPAGRSASSSAPRRCATTSEEREHADRDADPRREPATIGLSSIVAVDEQQPVPDDVHQRGEAEQDHRRDQRSRAPRRRRAPARLGLLLVRTRRRSGRRRPHRGMTA